MFLTDDAYCSLRFDLGNILSYKYLYDFLIQAHFTT